MAATLWSRPGLQRVLDRLGQDRAREVRSGVGQQREWWCETVQVAAGGLADQADGVVTAVVEGEGVRR